MCFVILTLSGCQGLSEQAADSSTVIGTIAPIVSDPNVWEAAGTALGGLSLTVPNAGILSVALFGIAGIVKKLKKKEN